MSPGAERNGDDALDLCVHRRRSQREITGLLIECHRPELSGNLAEDTVLVANQRCLSKAINRRMAGL
jgi:hypothetical protein